LKLFKVFSILNHPQLKSRSLKMSFKRPYLLSTLILLTSPVQAGDLDPPSNPQNTSSYTLTDICNRLDTGAAGSKSTFNNPNQGPSATGCTLDQVMEKAPAKDVDDGAKPKNVEAGMKYWGLVGDNWGVQTGTGKVGGVDCPTDVSRFTDNNNGTVTDNCTKLIWLKNANCFGEQTWANAKSSANNLDDDKCGLTDNSKAGDWHSPTVHELQSLIDYSKYNPALPNEHPFSGVQTGNYWSCTERATSTGHAWNVYLNNGYVGTNAKTTTDYVWPVRRSQ
jgi:hypothetical protein